MILKDFLFFWHTYSLAVTEEIWNNTKRLYLSQENDLDLSCGELYWNYQHSQNNSTVVTSVATQIIFTRTLRVIFSYIQYSTVSVVCIQSFCHTSPSFRKDFTPCELASDWKVFWHLCRLRYACLCFSYSYLAYSLYALRIWDGSLLADEFIQNLCPLQLLLLSFLYHISIKYCVL